MMTNGIKAARPMLARLAKAGLDDLALHVDLTQERKGYATEESLNVVRAEYIERAKGLGLRILFNTTVYDGNFAELPVTARFFRQHADAISLISFQMQADTGRGVLRDRDDVITQASVMGALSDGMDLPLDFDVTSVGHSLCNRYSSVLAAGDARQTTERLSGCVALVGAARVSSSRLGRAPDCRGRAVAVGLARRAVEKSGQGPSDEYPRA